MPTKENILSQISKSKLAKEVSSNLSENLVKKIRQWDYFLYDEFGSFINQEESITTIDNLLATDIVGQWQHYAGQTWKNALLRPEYKPKKMLDALKLYEQNPDYYSESRSDMSFSSMDGKNWYSVEGNNHRTVIAKCLAELGHIEILKDVSLRRYSVDFVAYNELRKLRKFIFYKKLPITICPFKPDKSSEVKFVITDKRINSNPVALDREEFLVYSEKTLKNPNICLSSKMAYHFLYLPKQHYLRPFLRS